MPQLSGGEQPSFETPEEQAAYRYAFFAGEFAGRLLAGYVTTIEENQSLRDKREHDDLTGVLTREVFLGRANKQMKANPKANFAVLVLDLDAFKTVNDQLGHSKGDEALAHIADTLKSTLRSKKDRSDLIHRGNRRNGEIGRLGGDEFGIFIELTKEKEDDEDQRQPEDRLNAAVNRLRETFDQFLAKPDNQQLRDTGLGLSVGSVIIQEQSLSAEDALKAADAAMRLEKAERQQARLTEDEIEQLRQMVSLLQKASIRIPDWLLERKDKE